MLIRIEPDSAASLAEQITAQVRQAIVTGDVEVGERLPSARDLAAGLDVNMHTVLRAYDALRSSGLIELRRGRGAIVIGGDGQGARAVYEAAVALVKNAAAYGITSNELASMIRALA